MSIIILIVIFTSGLCSTLLFRKASGTLALGKMNMVSYLYFLFMLQTFIGISLVMIGFDEHYSFKYLLNREESIRITFIAIMAVSILWPLAMCMFQKVLKINARIQYTDYLKREIVIENQEVSFVVICMVTVVCVGLLALYFAKIGYVPFFKLISAPDDFNYALERIRISKVSVIHPYVTNIIILSMIPLLSYIAFAYALSAKKLRWWGLSFVLLCMSVVVKTHGFDKAPVIFHLFVHVLIFIYCQGGIRNAIMMVCGACGVVLIQVMYLVTGYNGTFLDLYNGPAGRTLFTQVGTLSYAFDLFPNTFPYLAGRSFAPNLLRLLGEDPSQHLRSAKLVMSYYGSEKVYDGVAGVMNAIFFGEAYANFGFGGILISVFTVALVITLFFAMILKLKKTPFMIAFAAIMTVKLGTASQGGFTDFVYNIDWIMTIIVFIGGYYCLECKNSVSNFIGTLINRVKKAMQLSRRIS